MDLPIRLSENPDLPVLPEHPTDDQLSDEGLLPPPGGAALRMAHRLSQRWSNNEAGKQSMVTVGERAGGAGGQLVCCLCPYRARSGAMVGIGGPGLVANAKKPCSDFARRHQRHEGEPTEAHRELPDGHLTSSLLLRLWLAAMMPWLIVVVACMLWWLLDRPATADCGHKPSPSRQTGL